MRLDQFCVGMKTYYFTVTNLATEPVSPVYCEVIAIGANQVRVRSELGSEFWASPELFEREVTNQQFTEATARPFISAS